MQSYHTFIFFVLPSFSPAVHRIKAAAAQSDSLVGWLLGLLVVWSVSLYSLTAPLFSLQHHWMLSVQLCKQTSQSHPPSVKRYLKAGNNGMLCPNPSICVSLLYWKKVFLISYWWHKNNDLSQRWAPQHFWSHSNYSLIFLMKREQ